MLVQKMPDHSLQVRTGCLCFNIDRTKTNYNSCILLVDFVNAPTTHATAVK